MTRDPTDRGLPPILAGKDYDAASVFEAANLLREARRQKRVAEIPVPEICVLDPEATFCARCGGQGAPRGLRAGPAITPSSTNSTTKASGSG
jgi:hypothetical protein